MTGLGSSCGACKFLRRKCTSECVFAPYFCYDQAAAHFAAVHKVFGASNVSKLLSHLPAYNRSAAAITISYEALARMRDPIYGCVAQIFALQQQVASLQEEVDLLGNQIANLNVGISSCESSQRTSIQNSEMQFSLHQDAMATEYYQTQPTVLLNHFGYTSGDQASDVSHMDIEISPPYGWEAENLLCDYEQTPLERHFEGVNKEMLTLLHDYTMGTTETENVQLGTKKSFSSNPFKLVQPEKSFGCKWD